MGRHALRGAVTAWLSLIVLETVVSNGTGKVAGAFAGVADLVNRALDPKVPAIPDRRTAGAPLPTAQQMTNPYLVTALASSNPSRIPSVGRAIPQ